MKATILIADDETDIRDEMADYLTRKGYKCLVYPDGKQALLGITAHAPDALVTDIKMPAMDGAELIAHTRALAPQTVIIAITGHGAHVGLDHIEGVDADAAFAKPVSLKKLLGKLEELLEARRSQASA